MRHNQGVSALLISDKVGRLLGNPLVNRLYKANSLALIWIIAQGILGIIENPWTLTRVRNRTFQIFAGTTPLEQRATFGPRLRYYLGKTISGFFFVAAIACAFVCPFIFVSSVVVNEFVTWGWPVSESEDAIGQVSNPRAEVFLEANVFEWGTWVSAAFVIIAAVIQKLSTKYRKAKGIEIPEKQTEEPSIKKESIIEDIKKFFKKDIKNFYKEFKTWYDDPVRVSTQTTPSKHSSEGESPPKHHYGYAKVPLVHVRHSPRSQTTPPPRSRSQSPMLQPSPHTPPWSSEISTGPYERPRSNPRDASRGSSLRPSLRSAYSSTEVFSRQGSSDRLLVPEYHAESGIPPQAAWANTAVLLCE